MIRKTTTILFALLISAAGAGAQTLTLNKANSLKGLSALYVSVISNGKVLDGAIRTETELRMRQAGIQVRPEELTTFLIQYNGLSIAFYLMEPVTLDRGSTRAQAVTWCLAGTVNPSSGINPRQTVYDAVSEFLNQWLADNPTPKLQLPTKIYQ
jgi:hypothetical protein